MKLIEVVNYDGKYEYIRADQIESVVKAGSNVHDYGAVVLLGGRRIALGYDCVATILKRLNEE